MPCGLNAAAASLQHNTHNMSSQSTTVLNLWSVSLADPFIIISCHVTFPQHDVGF